MTAIIIFIILVIVAAIIILILAKKQGYGQEGNKLGDSGTTGTSNSGWFGTKSGFTNEGFYGAAPGTKPVAETTTMEPGNVVKVEYFYMPACPYCVKYSPIFDDAIERLTPDFPKLDVRKYNIKEAGNEEVMKKSTGKPSGNTVPAVVIWYDDGRKLSLNAAQRNHLELYVRYTK